MRHMQTKFITKKFRNSSNTYDQSSIFSGCSCFQNTASIRCSPESRRTCFSCRLGDVGIFKMSFFEGSLRHMCMVPYTKARTATYQIATPIKCLMAAMDDLDGVFLPSFLAPQKNGIFQSNPPELELNLPTPRNMLINARLG